MLSIGALARRAQCPVLTIRYYENQGLMPKAGRNSGGQRVYQRRDLAQLNFILRCRDLDVPLNRIRDLLAIEASGKACGDTLDFFRAQRQAITARIAALRDLDVQLSMHISACENGCMATGEPCTIFDSVAGT